MTESVTLLDEMIASTPRPIAPAPVPGSADIRDNLNQSTVVLTGKSVESSRLPSNLPMFRGSGITDPDAFIEQMSNNLLAHGVSESRWTRALLLGCSEPADASFVKESLLELHWGEACRLFLSRFRDPLYFHRLQTEFYT